MLRTAVVLAVVVTAQAARANPAGFVPASGHRGIAEVHLEVDDEYAVDSALITRERIEAATDPLAPLPRQPELEFRQSRHVLTPRIEAGLYRSLWISFAVPIVIGQSRELDLASGVERGSLTTISDGLVPQAGFDARAQGAPLSGDAVFRGVDRAGVPELRGGLGIAPMNQALDDTKPTWKLGVEMRFAIGRLMRFNLADNARETGVSTGVHELRLWTSVDRRFRYFEGWFEAFWQRPVYAREKSLFKDPGFGATNVAPGQTAGASFGVEGYIVNDAATGNRVSLDLGARIAAHFEGRGYSEMWEVFALAGTPGGGRPLVLDADPVMPGEQVLRHPGVSNIEGYLETAGRLALRGKLGSHLTIAALAELMWKTDRVISFADAGIDLPTCSSGAPRCETDDNDVVSPNSPEINPLHVRRVDLVGHRYHAEDSRSFVVGAQLQLMF